LSKQINAYVKVRNGESIDSALKRFNAQIHSSDILNDIREKEYYLKPSARKRLKRIQSKMNKDM